MVFIQGLVLILLGAATGFLSGLLGVGGGFLLVPALSLLGRPMASTIGTSLFYVAVIGFSAAVQHLKAGNVDRRFVAVFATFAVLTAPIGAYLTNVLPEASLRMLFGAFLGFVSFSMTRGGIVPNTRNTQSQH